MKGKHFPAVVPQDVEFRDVFRDVSASVREERARTQLCKLAEVFNAKEEARGFPGCILSLVRNSLRFWLSAFYWKLFLHFWELELPPSLHAGSTLCSAATEAEEKSRRAGAGHPFRAWLVSESNRQLG